VVAVAMTRRSERGDDAERCPPAGAPRGTKGEAEREAREIVERWEKNDEWNRRADARHEEGSAGRWLARIREQREGLIETIAAALERHQGASGGVRTRVETFKGLPPLVVHELALKPHDVGEACSYCDASAPASGAAPDGDGRETAAVISAGRAANHPLIRRTLLDTWHDLKWYRANAREHPDQARATVEALEHVLALASDMAERASPAERHPEAGEARRDVASLRERIVEALEERTAMACKKACGWERRIRGDAIEHTPLHSPECHNAQCVLALARDPASPEAQP
jgi:hypothetical protein